MRTTVFAAAFLSASAFRERRASCGVKGLSAQIVNGDDATECAWNWQVGLKRRDTDDLPFCGGMLIDANWVMTAAHCIIQNNVFVTAGEHDVRYKTGNEQTIKSLRITPHPDYNSETMDYDYALIQMSEPFDLGYCVGTVCLPEAGDLSPGDKCWVTGWGTLKSGGNQPMILQQAEVSIISNTDCHEKTGYGWNDITDRMICAQGRASNGSVTDACQGDSGGPLVCSSGGSWTLYGATSWGYGCADAQYPGIWARVHTVMPWIKTTMGSAEPAPDRCPNFAKTPLPDQDGDCSCPGSQKCSTTGPGVLNCPSAGGIGGYGGGFFRPDCSTCMCY